MRYIKKTQRDESFVALVATIISSQTTQTIKQMLQFKVVNEILVILVKQLIN